MTAQLSLNAGEDTEDLAEYVLNALDDETLDEVDVEREHAPAHGLANEPVTLTVVLTLAPPLIAGVTTLIKNWMDNRSKERQLELTIVARGVSPEAQETLDELATRPGVTVTQE